VRLIRWLVPVLIWLAGCLVVGRAADGAEVMLPEKFQRLLPLHEPLGKPGPFDWLAHHPEPGQTFGQYVASRPVVPDRRRRTIYVQPLGEFTEAQQRIVELAGRYLRIYFDLPAEVRPAMPLKLIPASARRRHPEWGMEQVLTGYVLEKILWPRLPRDAGAYLAFTPTDLWPGEGWNFVFGQASLRQRVGVWSIYRFGDPDRDDETFRLCLKRTIKTAAHETAHMFSMLHCIQFRCAMNGSNHLAESDRRPLWLCPHCLAKLCWATKADPEKRFRDLAAFCTEQGFDEEAEFFRKSLAAIQGRR